MHTERETRINQRSVLTINRNGVAKKHKARSENLNFMFRKKKAIICSDYGIKK